MAEPPGAAGPPRATPLTLRAARRGLRSVDRLVSRLELRASGIELREPVTFGQRLVLRELAWALRTPGTVVFDVGAATGEHTVAFAKVASVAEVVAFEPLAESFRSLVDRTRGHPNVRCLNVALGEQSGLLKLNRSAWRDTSSFLPVGELTRAEFPRAAQLEGAEDVVVARLDDVVVEQGLAPPDLVKIDVQGFEDRVIQGGVRTLRAARICVIEVSFRPLYEGSPLFDDVYSLMREMGFRLTGFAGSLAASGGELLQADAVFESVSGPSK